MFWDQDDFAPLATMTDAAKEYARNVGRDNPDRAWILTDYDTWEANPFYTGPRVPHPDSDMVPDDDIPDNADTLEDLDGPQPLDPYADDLDGDIPF